LNWPIARGINVRNEASDEGVAAARELDAHLRANRLLMALLYFADEALLGKLTARGEGSFLELARRYAHDTTLKPHLRQALQQHVDLASHTESPLSPPCVRMIWCRLPKLRKLRLGSQGADHDQLGEQRIGDAITEFRDHAKAQASALFN